MRTKTIAKRNERFYVNKNLYVTRILIESRMNELFRLKGDIFGGILEIIYEEELDSNRRKEHILRFVPRPEKDLLLIGRDRPEFKVVQMCGRMIRKQRTFYGDSRFGSVSHGCETGVVLNLFYDSSGINVYKTIYDLPEGTEFVVAPGDDFRKASTGKYITIVGIVDKDKTLTFYGE